jgi:hypothetical protein
MVLHKLLNNALASQLEIDAVSITLTQCQVSNPAIFQGTGKIVQDSEGRLTLHMIHVGTPEQLMSQMTADEASLNTLPGTIVGDDYYFDMVCTDASGVEWTAEKINLSKNHYYFPTNSVVIKPHLYAVTRRVAIKTPREYDTLQFVIPYSVELPCNEFEPYGNGGRRRSIFKIQLDAFDMTINNAEEKLVVSVTTHRAMPTDILSKAILSGLSILVGRQLLPLTTEIQAGSLASIEVKSLKKISPHALPRPFESSVPTSYANALKFLDHYITTYLQHPDQMAEFYGYWHKIFVARGASLELWALALTTSIEGVFKQHFSPLLKHDAAYEEKLNASIVKLKKTDIDIEVMQKLETTLINFKQKNITAGLRTFVTDKPHFSHWPTDWSKLRNQAAHADILGNSPEKMQKYYDRTFTCLAIFYHLLAATILYDGALIAYGTPGWPELPLTLPAQTVDAKDEQ